MALVCPIKRMPPWSVLPHDLIASIAKRLFAFEDFIAFGAVCTSWKSAATKENFTTRRQIPLLMLPEKEKEKESTTTTTTATSTVREFYNLKNGKVFQLNMPDLVRGKLCYSSLGWLMTQSDKDSKLDLLHPLNHSRIELPDAETFKKHHSDLDLSNLKTLFGDFLVRKFVLSSSPSCSSDYTVMIHSWERLAFCRPGIGDQQWNVLMKSEKEDHLYFDITYYKGKFYAVDAYGTILVCEIEDPMQARTRVIVPKLPEELGFPFLCEKEYLVESAGALLLVTRSFIPTFEFRVFEVPLSNGDWSDDARVKSLGNRTLFLGYNSSFSVESSNYGCKANCIYYTNHPPALVRQEEEIDMGIFYMEDGKAEADLREPINSLTPHLWVEPSF
ncbi:F-box protein At2g26160-like [Malus sylvestris]|uniref:F-box protein At2g26160-like n=1 Tax=Malus sylvestris TaxID=3752 RepID=UPI0021AC708B|nr:F-box protein At2g26160-like [Malus sylvestris]